jgi:thymidylate synthase
MVRHFAAETCDDAWRLAASELLAGRDAIRGTSRLGRTREYLHCLFEIEDPRQRWVLSRTPAMNPAFAIAEVIWILLGSDNANFINFWNPRLPKYAGYTERYHGAYGHRLRFHFGVDQIARACDALEANRDSRQVVLQIWDVHMDLPEKDGAPQAADIPCNLVSMLKVREGKLHWMQVMRSNDLFLGAPHNFVQFTCLQEIVAGCLGVELGPYVQLSDSLHLYERDVEDFGVTPQSGALRSNDRLGLKRTELDEVLACMHKVMIDLTGENLSRSLIPQILRRNDLPQAWRNLVCVLAAEAARRRDWLGESVDAISACTNPVLSLTWRAWQERTARATATRSTA